MSLACFVLALLPVPLHAAPAQTITVGAAASLQDAMTVIVRAFEKEYSVAVRVTYAGSGKLRKQIEAGAPIDVFLTARSGMLDAMIREGRITASRVFATNVLVVIVPASSGAGPSALGDLVAPRYARIGIGNPGYVPAGAYAKTALENAGVDEAIRGRLIYGEHVRQVLAYAARGVVDAAIVYRTDAEGRDDVRVAFELPLPAGEGVVYSGGMTAGAANPSGAAAFLEYIGGDSAKAILRRNSFGPPETPTGGAHPARPRDPP